MSTTTTRLLQRQILPADHDYEVFPLYIDVEDANLDEDKYVIGGDAAAKAMANLERRKSTGTGRQLSAEQILDRTRLRVDAGQRLSFGTYFNGFPAGYWRRYTIVETVRLTVTLHGQGSTVVVNKSLANGNSQRVDTGTSDSIGPREFVFDLPLTPFVDGGWYWYDIVAGDEPVVVSAEWTAEVPEDRAARGTVDIAITTMNRPDFCSRLLQQIGGDEHLAPFIDTVFVMEQGTKLVEDDPEFPAAQELLGDKLRILKQGNLGGSGGYARGQLESIKKGTATYALMMDDDVECEPESIVRQVTFGDLCKVPTLVGGHMFSLYARTRLHSYGEIVQPWRFLWMTRDDGHTHWDFATRNLRSARWLHKRADVDFNGWFSCLIPTQVIREIGLSLPVFIKWDDSEYGLRAKAHGYPTVSFPGAAVWHVPWSDKNDALDWQSYFHLRNRLIAGLLHSAYPKGGRLLTEIRNNQIAHLVAMQYSTAELRIQAMEDILKGPEHLHEMLPTRLKEINDLRMQFSDAQLHRDIDSLPPVRLDKPTKRGASVTEVPSRKDTLKAAGLAPLRQFLPERRLSREFPEAEVPALDAKWYRLAGFDSAIVSMNDGNSAALYRRDRSTYAAMLRRSLALHMQFRRDWSALSVRYRQALSEITSPEAWEETFKPWTEGDQRG